MENHLDFIVIKAEPKFRADSFVLDEADCSAAPVETGIVPVTLSLYACDKRDTAARRAWDNFGVVTEMVPLGLLSGFLLLSQAYEDADVLIDDCLYLDQPLGEMVDQLTAHGYDCENTFIITDVLLTPAAHNQDVLDLEIKPPSSKLEGYLAQEPIRLRGKIVRISRSGTECHYGISFEGMAPSQNRELEMAQAYYLKESA